MTRLGFTNIPNFFLGSMEKTIIPKDCFVCDHCNKALSDDKFIASENLSVIGEPICVKRCKIYQAFQAGESNQSICEHDKEIVGEETYCEDCEAQYKDHIAKYNLKTTAKITKGDDCSKTVLAQPIIFWG